MTDRSVRIFNRVWCLLAIVFVVAGVPIGYRLSVRDPFVPHKVLSIVSCIFALLGLLIGSYFLTESIRLKALIATWVAVCVGHLVAFSSLGMLAAAAVCRLLEYPSAGKTVSFALNILIWGGFPLVFLESFVIKPQWTSQFSLDVRLRILTAFLLVGAVLIQLFASILDFLSE